MILIFVLRNCQRRRGQLRLRCAEMCATRRNHPLAARRRVAFPLGRGLRLVLHHLLLFDHCAVSINQVAARRRAARALRQKACPEVSPDTVRLPADQVDQKVHHDAENAQEDDQWQPVAHRPAKQAAVAVARHHVPEPLRCPANPPQQEIEQRVDETAHNGHPPPLFPAFACAS